MHTMSGITPEMIERAAASVHRRMANEAEDQMDGRLRRRAAFRHLHRFVVLAPGMYFLIVGVGGALITVAAFLLGVYVGGRP
jgi:hypothetical protein